MIVLDASLDCAENRNLGMKLCTIQLVPADPRVTSRRERLRQAFQSAGHEGWRLENQSMV